MSNFDIKIISQSILYQLRPKRHSPTNLNQFRSVGLDIQQ